MEANLQAGSLRLNEIGQSAQRSLEMLHQMILRQQETIDELKASQQLPPGNPVSVPCTFKNSERAGTSARLYHTQTDGVLRGRDAARGASLVRTRQSEVEPCAVSDANTREVEALRQEVASLRASLKSKASFEDLKKVAAVVDRKASVDQLWALKDHVSKKASESTGHFSSLLAETEARVSKTDLETLFPRLAGRWVRSDASGFGVLECGAVPSEGVETGPVHLATARYALNQSRAAVDGLTGVIQVQSQETEKTRGEVAALRSEVLEMREKLICLTGAGGEGVEDGNGGLVSVVSVRRELERLRNDARAGHECLETAVAEVSRETETALQRAKEAPTVQEVQTVLDAAKQSLADALRVGVDMVARQGSVEMEKRFEAMRDELTETAAERERKREGNHNSEPRTSPQTPSPQIKSNGVSMESKGACGNRDANPREIGDGKEKPNTVAPLPSVADALICRVASLEKETSRLRKHATLLEQHMKDTTGLVEPLLSPSPPQIHIRPPNMETTSSSNNSRAPETSTTREPNPPASARPHTHPIPPSGTSILPEGVWLSSEVRRLSPPSLSPFLSDLGVFQSPSSHSSALSPRAMPQHGGDCEPLTSGGRSARVSPSASAFHPHRGDRLSASPCTVWEIVLGAEALNMGTPPAFSFVKGPGVPSPSVRVLSCGLFEAEAAVFAEQKTGLTAAILAGIKERLVLVVCLDSLPVLFSELRQETVSLESEERRSDVATPPKAHPTELTSRAACTRGRAPRISVRGLVRIPQTRSSFSLRLVLWPSVEKTRDGGSGFTPACGWLSRGNLGAVLKLRRLHTSV